jgi:hypothetical protein
VAGIVRHGISFQEGKRVKLAYVTIPGRGQTDTFIAEVVNSFEAQGFRLAGTSRSGDVDAGCHPCDMDLRVLPDGPVFRISQPLGKGARGCRIDGGIIESIAAEVEARLSGADLLVVNKFGKQEAQGRGLCPAISMALELGIPTLVGVNEMNISDFCAFSDGVAEFLAPDPHAIRTWYHKDQALRALATV